MTLLVSQATRAVSARDEHRKNVESTWILRGKSVGSARNVILFCLNAMGYKRCADCTNNQG